MFEGFVFHNCIKEKMSNEFSRDLSNLAYSKVIKYSNESLEDSEKLYYNSGLFIRGKSIPSEVALEIIRKTDYYIKSVNNAKAEKGNIIKDIFREKGIESVKSINSDNVLFSIYINNWFPGPNTEQFGWCHPDGYIGMNNYSLNRTTHTDNLIYPWIYLGELMQYLDLIVIITDTSECKSKQSEISSNIQVGILVKNNQIEILDKDRAMILFEDYDKAYGSNQCDGPIQSSQIDTYSENDNYLLIDDDIQEEIPKLSKNDAGYYGIPDYTYQTGIVTVEDLYRFADKWLEDPAERREDL